MNSRSGGTLALGDFARRVEDLELLASSMSSSGETFEVYREAGTTRFALHRVGEGAAIIRAQS